jgi:hypothetical protein
MSRQYCLLLVSLSKSEEVTEAFNVVETHLRLQINSAETVEKLEWGEDMALDENGGGHRGCCPPSCARGHLIKPLLQRKLARLPVISPYGCHLYLSTALKSLSVDCQSETADISIR